MIPLTNEGTPMTALCPFHLAFPVDDLTAARDFYGHQIVAHLAPDEAGAVPANAVDGHGVPVRHFGVVLPMHDWQVAADKLTAAGVEFIIKPYIRFKGEPGEQATMFFKDPSGNAVEMKAFADINNLFAR